MFAGFVSIAVASTLTAATPEETLRSIGERYSTMKSFKASVKNSILDKASGNTTVMSGTIVYSSPNKFRVEIGSPAEQTMVSDGSTLWIYMPASNQVIVTKPSKAQETFLFISHMKEQRGKYDVSFKEDSLLEAHFTAKKDAKVAVKDFSMFIDKTKLEIVGLRVDTGDQVMNLRYTSFTRNVETSGIQFTFTPPSGTTVVKDTGD
jgi:outer membrane lipoprotein carrier protein